MVYELLLLNIIRNSETQAIHFKECLGQHLIASYVKQYGFNAKVYSGDVLSAKSVISNEIDKSQVDILGFYVGADTVVMVSHIIKWIKSVFPDKYVIVGGPEAYALGEKFLADTKCDYIIAGEGEIPMLNILKFLYEDKGELKDIKSLRYIDYQGVYHCNPLEDLIENLDDIPFPDNRNSLNKSFRMRESIGILTGRGCPYNCAFCFEGATSKTVRLRSMSNVIREIEEVRKSNPNLLCVSVYDDTFTLDEKRVMEFCQYMKMCGLRWTCEGHVARICQKPDMIRVMVESGLLAMQIGIESGSQKVLDGYNKHTTPEMIERVVEICKEAGVPTLEGNYIIGGAFETEETLTESLEHAKRLIDKGRGMIEISTVFFSPYFGSPITKKPEKFDMTIDQNEVEHNVVTMRDVVVETKELNRLDIIRWKEYFEDEIKKHYYEVAKTSNKNEIIKGMSIDSKRLRINQNWMAAWKLISYMSEFSMHASEEEQTIEEYKYPIRTISNYDYYPGRFIAQGVELKGVEADAIYWANGRNTVQEVSDILGVEIEFLKEIFSGLNERCLVYYSEF